MELGERVKKARIDAGLTQRELGEPYYSPSFVSTIEAGKRRPSMEAAEHFAGKLSMTVEELLLGSRETSVKIQERIQEARRSMSSGPSDKAMRLLTTASREAAREGLEILQGQADYLRGLTLERSGEISQALEVYQATEDLLRDDAVAVTDAVTGRARCYQTLGELPYATYLLEAHLARLRIEDVEEPNALIRLYTSLVAAYFDGNMDERAAEAAAAAFELAGHTTDPERVANMYVHVARVHMTGQRFQQAERAFDKANDIYELLQLPMEKGRVLLARAFALIAQDRVSEARVALELALVIFRSTGHMANEARTLLQLGRVLRIQGQFDESQLVLRRVAKITAEGTESERGIAQRELALGSIAAGDSASAVRHLEKAIQLFEKADDLRELAVAYRTLGDLRRDAQEIADACEAYRLAAVTVERAA